MNSHTRKEGDQLRICFLTESFFPPAIGGLEKHAYQLAEKLNSRGLTLFVITRKLEVDTKEVEQVGNVLIRRIEPVGEFKGKGWKAVVPILRMLITVFYLLIKYNKKYNIILVSGIKFLSIPAILVSLFFRKKSVIKIESPIELWEDISGESMEKMGLSKPSFLLKLLRAERNFIIKRTDSFIAISSEIRRMLINLGVEPEKIYSIPNGIETEKFYPVLKADKIKLRKKLLLPRDKTILIFTGRLAVSKGVLLLADVFETLIRKYADIHLLLVGSGLNSFDDCEFELRKFIEKNKIESYVSFTGIVNNVNEYLMASDVFIFPSKYEGFGLSIIEALACGLPVIASNVGIAGELIDNYRNGITVNPGKKEELQNATEWILENKNLWEKIGENARESIMKFGIEEISGKYQEMFTYLAAR